MDTSSTELIAKPSTDVADNSPVNRTDNCLLSDCSILPDSSVFDPSHHPVMTPAQPGYLPEQLPRDWHPVEHPQQFVTSAVIYLSTSEPQSEIFHARSIDKLYSCDTTKGTDELPELPKLLKDKESVIPSHEQKEEEIPKPNLHGIAIPIPGHSTESQKHEPMSSKVVEVNKPVGEQPTLQEACPHTNDTSAITSLASLVPLPSGFTVSRPLWEHSDNEQSSFLLDMSSPTAYDHKPLNLVQKALDIAPPHSKWSEEQVTATAISSTEQLVEPCTQKTGSLLGHRADNSHLSNSSFSLGSSKPKPYRHPEQY